MELVIFLIAITALWLLTSRYRLKKRREALLRKYRDPEAVDRIMKRMFWQGQTRDQLLDSLGQPLDIDERALKLKIKETWKYNRLGKNRFGLRVVIENGVVVGWDQK